MRRKSQRKYSDKKPFLQGGLFVPSAEKRAEQYYLQYYNGYSCVILKSFKGWKQIC